MIPISNYLLPYFRRVYNVPKDIFIGYGTTDHKLNIKKTASRYFDSYQPYNPLQIIWKTWQETRLPFLFDDTDIPDILMQSNGKTFINYDILSSAFFWLSGWQEYVYMRSNSAIRFPYKNSLQYKLGILETPVVNYYFDILKHAIETAYDIRLNVRAWENAPYCICLTHDIDRAMTGWREDLASSIRKANIFNALKVVSEVARHGDTCFNLNDIMDLESRYQARASYYFLGQKGSVYARESSEKGFSSENGPKHTDLKHFFHTKRSTPYTQHLQNADYDIASPKFQRLLREIRRRGFEVGIHGSFGSSLSSESFAKDRQQIGGEILGGRFHYLCFDITRTFDILEQASMSYDSTLGFAEVPGFRNGICFPFPPYHFSEKRPYRILEIPLVVMDTTLRSYQNITPELAYPVVERLCNVTAKFNGCLTVLWHNNFFSPYKFAGWREVYESLLQKGANDKALMVSAKAVCQRWKGIYENSQ